MHMLENQGIRTEREKDKDNSTKENHTKTTRLAWHPGKVAKQQATCIMQTAGTDPKQGSVSGVGERISQQRVGTILYSVFRRRFPCTVFRRRFPCTVLYCI